MQLEEARGTAQSNLNLLEDKPFKTILQESIAWSLTAYYHHHHYHIRFSVFFFFFRFLFVFFFVFFLGFVLTARGTITLVWLRFSDRSFCLLLDLGMKSSYQWGAGWRIFFHSFPAPPVGPYDFTGKINETVCTCDLAKWEFSGTWYWYTSFSAPFLSCPDVAFHMSYCSTKERRAHLHITEHMEQSANDSLSRAFQ